MIRHPTIPIYAQAEEDIIIAGLLDRLNMGQIDGTFVEIGVGDGTRNNTRSLAERGWEGVWIGNEPLVFEPPSVKFHFAQVELDNLESLNTVLPLGLDQSCDLFSLDIDGNDYWIADQLVPLLMPRILVVEYNKDVEPHWIMPYTPGYKWKPGMPFGASLPAWIDLLLPFGYSIVTTTQAQVNAFFVRS